MKCIITLPCYNERGNLEQLVPSIDKALDGLMPYKIIAVDDGSTDGTEKILLKLSQQYPLKLLEHRTNKGLASALETGLNEAVQSASDDDLIITMDADNTHDPRYIPILVRASKKADMVISSRYVKGGKQCGVPLLRLILSRTINKLIKVVSGIPVDDATSGFRCYRVSLLRKARKAFGKLIRSKGFDVSFEILLKTYLCNLRIAEVPNTLDYGRKIGKSKVNIVTTICRYILFLSKILVWRALRMLKYEHRRSL